MQAFEPTDEPGFDTAGAPTSAPAVDRTSRSILMVGSYPGGLLSRPNSSFLVLLLLAFETIIPRLRIMSTRALYAINGFSIALVIAVLVVIWLS